MRALALGAILVVLLAGIGVTVWRGDPITPELMTPLGLITALLVWSEKHGDKNQDQDKDKGGPSVGPAPDKEGGAADE